MSKFNDIFVPVHMVCRAVFAVFVLVLAVCWVTQLSLPVSLLLMVLLVLLGCARPVVTSAVSAGNDTRVCGYTVNGQRTQ